MEQVRVERHGSLMLVIPETDEARAWLRENVSGEATWAGDAVVVEPRYVNELLEGLRAALG